MMRPPCLPQDLPRGGHSGAEVVDLVIWAAKFESLIVPQVDT
jgi:hypothetical protein